MKILVTETAFNPWDTLQHYQESPDFAASPGKSGGINVFVGSMRDINEGDDVTGMTLEHYPAMTQKQLSKLARQAQEEWQLQDVLLIHRVGEIRPDETIVLVATWAEHRAEAFAATRFLIDELKHSAPFWKKEILQDGKERWIEKNT